MAKRPHMTKYEAKELYIDGSLDLLHHLKRSFQRALDLDYSPESLPEELVSAYNQLILLLNNSISGLRLPASMERSMIADIRSTLTDQALSLNSELADTVKQLQAATNIYISIANAESQINATYSQYRSQGVL